MLPLRSRVIGIVVTLALGKKSAYLSTFIAALAAIGYGALVHGGGSVLGSIFVACGVELLGLSPW